MDPKEEYIENCRCENECQKLNTSAKGVYVTQLSDAHIQLKIFEYIDGVTKKTYSLSTDEEILLLGNRIKVFPSGENGGSPPPPPAENLLMPPTW